MIRGAFVIATVVLTFSFLIWKVAAAGFGLSGRRKWVWVVDATGLTAVAGCCAGLHIAWRALYRPGGGVFFLIGAGIYLAIVVWFTRTAYDIDAARHTVREVRELPPE
jgi:hypothetical protein